jgi:hypothetical protein
MTGGDGADKFAFALLTAAESGSAVGATGGVTAPVTTTADTITDFTTADDSISTSKAAGAVTIADGTALTTIALFTAAADAVFAAGAGADDVYAAWNAGGAGAGWIAVDENDSGSFDAGDTFIILTGVNLAAELVAADFL